MIMVVAVLVLFVIVIVVMMMFVFFILIIVMVMMVMMSAIAALIIAFMLMLMSCKLFVSFFSELIEFSVQSFLRFHYFEDLGSAELIPVCSHDRCLRVELSDGSYDPVKLLSAHSLLM